MLERKKNSREMGFFFGWTPMSPRIQGVAFCPPQIPPVCSRGRRTTPHKGEREKWGAQYTPPAEKPLVAPPKSRSASGGGRTLLINYRNSSSSACKPPNGASNGGRRGYPPKGEEVLSSGEAVTPPPKSVPPLKVVSPPEVHTGDEFTGGSGGLIVRRERP